MRLALRAKGKTSPNPMVGALLVKNNRLLAQGWHKYCGWDHAEIIALKNFKKNGRSARGAKLYVTLDPCFHYGRTPPCVDQVIASGIKEVVIGMKDPNPRTFGKSIQKLKRSGVKVRSGILEPELKKMNEVFTKYITTEFPFVVAKCAQTLDGKVASSSGQSKWITSPKTREYARRIRNEFDAILVGANTVLRDDPLLDAHSRAKKITKIIIDSALKVSTRARVFKHTNPAQCIIATTKKASRRTVEQFQKQGVQVMICPQKAGMVDLKWLFKELAKREISSILIEGGPTVVGNALKAGLVDKMHVYIAPKVLGDQGALSAVQGFTVKNVNQSIRLKSVEIKKIGDDILLQGYVYRNR